MGTIQIFINTLFVNTHTHQHKGGKPLRFFVVRHCALSTGGGRDQVAHLFLMVTEETVVVQVGHWATSELSAAPCQLSVCG